MCNAAKVAWLTQNIRHNCAIASSGVWCLSWI